MIQVLCPKTVNVVETSGCTKLSPKDSSMTPLMFHIMYAICVAANTPFKRDFKLSQNVISTFFGRPLITEPLQVPAWYMSSNGWRLSPSAIVAVSGQNQGRR